MPRWSPRTTLILTLALSVAIGGFALLRDARRDRIIIVATPAPAGVFSHPIVSIPPGKVLCMSPVTFPTDANVANLLHPASLRPSLLRVDVVAGSQRQSTVVRSGVLGSVAAFSAPIPPLRHIATGRVCVRNIGTHTAGLIGTDEASFQTLTVSTIDGQKAPASVTLYLTSSKPQTLLSRFNNGVGLANLLTGGLPKVLIWLLVALVAVGMPVATVAAVISTFRKDD